MNTKTKILTKTHTSPTQSVLAGVVFLLISFTLPALAFMPNPALASGDGLAGAAVAETEAYVERAATRPEPIAQTLPAPSEAAETRNTPAEMDREAVGAEIIAALNENFDASHLEKGLIIPILAVLLIFGMPPIVLIVLIVMIFRARRRAQQYRADALARLLEAGREVPLELVLGEGERPVDAQVSLHKGVRNLGLGLGVAVCFGALFGWQAATLGLILVGLGSAQVLSARIAKSPVDAP